jgi:hypothetical protein
MQVACPGWWIGEIDAQGRLSGVLAVYLHPSDLM